MIEDTNKISDLTLERVRRIEARFDRVDDKLTSLTSKMDALIDMMAPMRADMFALHTLAIDANARLNRVETRLERGERRLDLASEPL